MERIALQNAGTGVGGVDELGAVITQHSDLIADAGEDALPPAGEASEEMGLDKALGDQQIGLGGHFIDDQPGAGGEHADVYVRLGISAVMTDELLFVGDLFPHLIHQLFMGGGAVEAGGDEQGDVDVGVAFPQLGQHKGENVLAGHRTGVIADDNGRGFLAFCQLSQAGRTHGRSHGLTHDVVLAAFCLQSPNGGFQDFGPGQVPVQFQAGGAVGNTHNHPSK